MVCLPISRRHVITPINAMKNSSISFVVAAAAALVASSAGAHVGLSNVTMPISVGGQSTFAIANTTNEILFNIPHGCTAAESQPAPATGAANLDTTKIQITIPAAIVTATTLASLRPTMDGLFGAVTVTSNADGSATLVWNRQLAASGQQNSTASDNHLYKLSVRLKVPATASATDYSLKKYQFLTVQYCQSTLASHSSLPAGSLVTMDWGTLNSPKLLVLPEKRKGFNKYTLEATTVADFTVASATATLAASLKSYFGDAAIVWVGKQGYSANPNTKTKIQSLAAKDSTYSELGDKVGVSLTATDTIWVKY